MLEDMGLWTDSLESIWRRNSLIYVVTRRLDDDTFCEMIVGG